LLSSSRQPDAARAMIAFMISPPAAPLLRKTHVEPAKPEAQGDRGRAK
jgi:hypothetical protein